MSSVQASVLIGWQDHVRRLEGGQCSLGLNASSVSSYRVGEITRLIGQLASLILRGGVLLWRCTCDQRVAVDSRLQPRCDPGRVFRTNVLSPSEDTTVWRYRNFIDLMDLNLINLKCIVHVIVINVIRQHHKYRDWWRCITSCVSWYPAITLTVSIYYRSAVLDSLDSAHRALRAIACSYSVEISAACRAIYPLWVNYSAHPEDLQCREPPGGGGKHVAFKCSFQHETVWSVYL